MDINLLVLAVGNSRLATGVFVAGELERVVRHPIADRGQWEGAIQQAWSRIADRAAPAIAAASVNPQINSLIDDIVQRRTGQGVSKSGSPAAKLRTSIPSAHMALALASSASVKDS